MQTHSYLLNYSATKMANKASIIKMFETAHIVIATHFFAQGFNVYWKFKT